MKFDGDLRREKKTHTIREKDILREWERPQWANKTEDLAILYMVAKPNAGEAFRYIKAIVNVTWCSAPHIFVEILLVFPWNESLIKNVSHLYRENCRDSKLWKTSTDSYEQKLVRTISIQPPFNNTTIYVIFDTIMFSTNEISFKVIQCGTMYKWIDWNDLMNATIMLCLPCNTCFH